MSALLLALLAPPPSSSTPSHAIPALERGAQASSRRSALQDDMLIVRGHGEIEEHMVLRDGPANVNDEHHAEEHDDCRSAPPEHRLQGEISDGRCLGQRRMRVVRIGCEHAAVMQQAKRVAET